MLMEQVQRDIGAELSTLTDSALGSWRSDDLAGNRHPEAGHDVEDLAADAGLDLLRRQSPGVQAAADQLLVPQHRDLAQGAASVADRPLPAQPTALVDQLNVAIASAGGACSGLGRHRRRARWNDHRRGRAVGGHRAITTL